MAGKAYVSYLRCSTGKQQASGLGLEAQREAVRRILQPHDHLIGEHIEVESGRRSDRAELSAAIAEARDRGAVLLIARLDRLARNVAFVAALMEAGVDFTCADNPTATRLTIHILAAVAEEEARLISVRTRAALAAAKARGVRLGNPQGAAALAGLGNTAAIAAARAKADEHARRTHPRIVELRAQGNSFAAIAAALNAANIITAQRKQWHATTVRNVVQRLGRPLV